MRAKAASHHLGCHPGGSRSNRADTADPQVRQVQGQQAQPQPERNKDEQVARGDIASNSSGMPMNRCATITPKHHKDAQGSHHKDIHTARRVAQEWDKRTTRIKSRMSMQCPGQPPQEVIGQNCTIPAEATKQVPAHDSGLLRIGFWPGRKTVRQTDANHGETIQHEIESHETESHRRFAFHTAARGNILCFWTGPSDMPAPRPRSAKPLPPTPATHTRCPLVGTAGRTLPGRL